MASALIDKARTQILLGDYAVARPSALADSSLHHRAQEFRRALSARMVALDKRAMHEKMPSCDYFVSRKIDGEFTILLVDCPAGTALTINPGGTVRIGLPVLEEACALLGKAGIQRAVFACELYVHRTDKRPRVHDVCRVARQPASAAELATLHLAVFDILELDGEPAPSRHHATLEKIQSIFKDGTRIHPVETIHAKDQPAIDKLYAQWVEKEGGEGLVARSDAAGMFKIKPRTTLDVAVIGYTEGSDDRAGMLHDMLVAVMRPEGTFHVVGRVGGGFTDDQRREFLSDLKDIPAETDYAEINDGVAYQMVKPVWAVEISCLDLINQNTRGTHIDRMVLDYAGDNGRQGYKAVRRLPLVSPISPQFIRKREDRQIVHADLRLQQVADVVEIPHHDKDSRALTLPRSEILSREVYTKVLKGQTMVRKLLLWKTNKEDAGTAGAGGSGAAGGGEYPAYVAYFTDFSPNRKTPLERDIRVSNSRDQILELLAGMKAEYIVKGWQPA
jgi:hypothetical protein